MMARSPLVLQEGWAWRLQMVWTLLSFLARSYLSLAGSLPHLGIMVGVPLWLCSSPSSSLPNISHLGISSAPRGLASFHRCPGSLCTPWVPGTQLQLPIVHFKLDPSLNQPSCELLEGTIIPPVSQVCNFGLILNSCKLISCLYISTCT